MSDEQQVVEVRRRLVESLHAGVLAELEAETGHPRQHLVDALIICGDDVDPGSCVLALHHGWKDHNTNDRDDYMPFLLFCRTLAAAAIILRKDGGHGQ